MEFLLAHHPGALGPIDHLGFRTITSVIGAALLDGMNPTALGVLLLILWQGIKSKRPVRTTALHYFAGLIVVYLAAGVVLREVYLDFGPNLVVQGLQTLLALLLFLSGLSELVAAIRQSGQRLGEIPQSLQGGLNKIGEWISRGFAFPLGLAIGLIELFATGAIYLTFVQAITYDPTAPWWVLLTMMVIYMAAFSLPMVAVIAYEPLVEVLLGAKGVSRGARAVRGTVGLLFMAAAVFIAASAFVTVASTTTWWWF